MIYLTYLRPLNLAGGNSYLTSISFPQLASDGELNVRRHDSYPVSPKSVLKMLWMCLSFGRILSLQGYLSVPLGSNDLQAPAFPGDATKAHVPGGGFLQGLANLPTVNARVSGVSFLQEATWNLNNRQEPCLRSMVIYRQRSKLQNEGLLVEKEIYHDEWRAFLAWEAAGFSVARWPQGPGQTSHLDRAPVWWLRLTELRVWPPCEY